MITVTLYYFINVIYFLLYRFNYSFNLMNILNNRPFVKSNNARLKNMQIYLTPIFYFKISQVSTLTIVEYNRAFKKFDLLIPKKKNFKNGKLEEITFKFSQINSPFFSEVLFYNKYLVLSTS